MATTSYLNTAIPEISERYAPTVPPEDAVEGSEFARTIKRVAQEDISPRDAYNVAPSRGTEDGDGWEEVHRVKTHLYRRHPLPIQCPRCWDVFKADSQLQLHLQQDPPCTIREKDTLHEGFTKDQEKRLRSRKKTHADMTDEDKWREIYMILFPDDDPSSIPPPHYSEDDHEDSSRGGSGELEDYATFIRREMPTLVRRELETLFQDEFRDVEERLRPRIAEIVLNLQPRLLKLYKQSQMPLSEYGPQSSSEPTLTPALSQGMESGAGSGTPITTGPGVLIPGASGVDYGGSGLNWACDQETELPGAEELGVNWDFEFDKLLSPMLFTPPEMEHGQSSGVAVQGL
ncbi:hypothetical protein MFIFM68171_06998 [Madurella fahalii]|uniref:C2H2-type domain-containing protein n=1 Tax=Madurella fahalii TaxID=1157608 RepID=A0ABQ0GGA5_9PEZI